MGATIIQSESIGGDALDASEKTFDIGLDEGFEISISRGQAPGSMKLAQWLL
jgi:hypothetical protein